LHPAFAREAAALWRAALNALTRVLLRIGFGRVAGLLPSPAMGEGWSLPRML
jgi:hypothetical protein